MRQLLALVITLLPAQAFSASTAARTYSVTPVITADAYAQGDQMGGLTKLTKVLPCSGCSINLDTLIVLDMAKAKDAFDIYFFSSGISLASADNAAISVTDANMATGFAGKISIAAADFTDTVDSAFATKLPAMRLAGTSGEDLWLALVCTDAGGCDYGATTDLVLKLVYKE